MVYKVMCISNCAGVSAAQLTINKQVAKGSWAVICVQSGKGTPPFGYTVGLHHKGLPELIIIGVPQKVSHSILNSCAARLVENKIPYASGETLTKIANLPVIIADVTSSSVKGEYTTQAELHYRSRDYKLQQIVIPDTKGKYPWDSDFDPIMKSALVLIGDKPLRSKSN